MPSINKVLWSTLAGLISLVAMAGTASAQVDPATALRKPLILGASVSSSYATLSPGDRAAQRYTTKASITNIAKSGKSGASYKGLTGTYFKDFSVILAIDFLFWDTTSSDANKGMKAADTIIAAAAEAGVPLILGDVPFLLGWQKTYPQINAHIHQVCKLEHGCYILEFYDLHKKATKDGLIIGGKKYYYKDLADDGLHPNAIGSEYIAGMMVNLLKNGRALEAEEEILH